MNEARCFVPMRKSPSAPTHYIHSSQTDRPQKVAVWILFHSLFTDLLAESY